jgi:hypothetical protein
MIDFLTVEKELVELLVTSSMMDSRSGIETVEDIIEIGADYALGYSTAQEAYQEMFSRLWAYTQDENSAAMCYLINIGFVKLQ